MNTQKIWLRVLEDIKLQISPANFRAWFSQTGIRKITDNKIIILVPSAFIGEQLKTRYLPIISGSLEKTCGQKPNLEFQVELVKPTKSEPEVFSFEVPQAKPDHNLNPRYTLENFVVGLSNNVAYAAAQAVIQNPGLTYNPLFIYGGTGVGKTHLMIGIGNTLVSKNPHLKVIYCSSEKFMNDYVSAIQNRQMGSLRARYRLADVLLIDDVQFFSGREGTQEEFFHTFNELQAKNSQMVITSDRPPGEIAKLEDRLKSRFQGGLLIDIQQPDFDTRVAILRAKCIERGEYFSEDALGFLASSSDTNIRELEGRLMQILQVLKTHNLPATMENISLYIKSSPPQKNLKVDPKSVLNTICEYFNLTQKELVGPKRQKELVLPRHLAMYFLSELLNMTVERVGQILGGRDHTTVMHGRDKIKKLIDDNLEIKKVFLEIKGRLIY